MSQLSKKLFGRDLSMRSTFCKYDPDVSGSKNTVHPENCMVSLISDRFLGEKFTKNILSKKFRDTRELFTYNLIADTIRCNLNCWFCYAWKYLDKENAKKCMPHFLSARELAEQFATKIRATSDLEIMRSRVNEKRSFSEKERQQILKHINKEIPFTRIRISGEEPLYSNGECFQTSNTSTDLLSQTIYYWIDFFRELDLEIGKIKQDKLINIATHDSDWHVLKHPVWLTESADRIMVRFDTNGIILGSDKYAGLFFAGLYDLFNSRALDHLHIQIDYSFKGATPIEYSWSQRKDLPVSPERNELNFDLAKHPQVRGYLNTVSLIENYAKQNPRFKNCISITVEKGIDHDPEDKLFLLYPGALDWEKFSSRFNFEFSDVVNCFDLNFGWNLLAKIYRYTNRGADIIQTDGKQSVGISSTSFSDFGAFRRGHKDYPGYRTLIYPVEQRVTPFGGAPHVANTTSSGGTVKVVTRKPERKFPQTEQYGIFKGTPTGWVLSGSQENWQVALQQNIWGARDKYRLIWENNLQEDQYVFFYVTKPVSGLIGVGKVTEKVKAIAPLWPDELIANKVIYPYRWHFKPIYVIQNPQSWQNKKISIFGKGISFFKSLNPLMDNQISKLKLSFTQMWGIDL